MEAAHTLGDVSAQVPYERLSWSRGEIIMKRLMNDVAAFHRATDTPVSATPSFPPHGRRALRRRLIEEEVEEFCRADREEDLVGVADALADIIYVVVGTSLEYGIPLHAVWDEVQRANMAKIDPLTGRVTKREDGKVLKPDGWEPPDIRAAVHGSCCQDCCDRCNSDRHTCKGRCPE
jgi:predicted HAD superfamily Cof-like phosphohydrolase